MRVTKEYSFPITVDQDEAVNRLKSFTSDKASVKNMIKNTKLIPSFIKEVHFLKFRMTLLNQFNEIFNPGLSLQEKINLDRNLYSSLQ